MQKPQKPKKREEDLGSRHHDWKDWEKGYNHLTGFSNNQLFDVYQRNENVRVRNETIIQSIQDDLDNMERFNRKQIEALREDYKVMMAYAYVYKLHSITGNPDNDELPLIKKRVKVQPASHHKPKAEPGVHLVPDDILQFYRTHEQKTIGQHGMTPKWRPLSFSRNTLDDDNRDDMTSSEDCPYAMMAKNVFPFMEEMEKLTTEDKENKQSENNIKLPPIGTKNLKLSNWKTFGNQKQQNANIKRPKRNALSEPPSRWRGRETFKLPKIPRPKSYIPETEFSCRTPKNSKSFYDTEAKKALSKLTSTHRRLHESQKLLQNIANPLHGLIDSKKTTSAILRDYRKGQQHVKKGPIKGLVKVEQSADTKPQIFENCIYGNNQEE